MDAVTQLQTYLQSITNLMALSMQYAWRDAGVVSIEQHKQAVQQEHADAEAKEAEEAKTTLPTITEGDNSTSSPAPIIPALSAPLYSGLHPSVEHGMADRAHQLFKRVLEADTLIQALPPLHAAPHDMSSQIEQIKYLEAYNEKAGQELKEAQTEAGQMQ